MKIVDKRNGNITLALRQHPEKEPYTPWAGVQTWERADEETCGSMKSREVPVVLHWQNLSKIFWNLLEKFALRIGVIKLQPAAWSITCFQTGS